MSAGRLVELGQRSKRSCETFRSTALGVAFVAVVHTERLVAVRSQIGVSCVAPVSCGLASSARGISTSVSATLHAASRRTAHLRVTQRFE